MLSPDLPADAQRIVAAYLKVVEADAAVERYPGSLRDLPHSKEVLRAAFKTSVSALLSVGGLTEEMRDYLEIAYVSLADYVNDESLLLLSEYVRAGEELAAGPRLTGEKAATDAWRRVTEQSPLAAQIAQAISAEAAQLRTEFRSWVLEPETPSAPGGGVAERP